MVKLYYANTNLVQEPEIFENYLSKVNTQRREKVLRCKQESDRRRSLLAGVLLRYALEQEGLCYHQLLFTQNAYGKPVLADEEKIFFSISHSGDYVICGIADKEIGVDIEHSRRMVLQSKPDRRDCIAKKSFSREEYQLYENAVDRNSCFLQLWTRKESYSKAMGRGLGMDFSKINVLGNSKKGQFWSDWLLEDYYVSVYLDADNMEAPKLLEWKEIKDV